MSAGLWGHGGCMCGADDCEGCRPQSREDRRKAREEYRADFETERDDDRWGDDS